MDDPLRDLLESPDPRARDDLRRVLIRDQADRDAISSYDRPIGEFIPGLLRHSRLPRGGQTGVR
jgi:hypothetical protein